MSPWQVGTRSNGGERFCRLSTTSPSLAARTWQSELSRSAFMGRSEPDAGSLHPTQQFFKKNSSPSRRRYWGSSTDILTKRMKKMTAIPVADVSQDGDTACDVHRRFVHPAMPMPDGVSCSTRCRQLRVLGGDRHHFLPLPSGQCFTRAKDYRRRQMRRFFRGLLEERDVDVWISEKNQDVEEINQYIRKGPRAIRAGGWASLGRFLCPARELDAQPESRILHRYAAALKL